MLAARRQTDLLDLEERLKQRKETYGFAKCQISEEANEGVDSRHDQQSAPDDAGPPHHGSLLQAGIDWHRTDMALVREQEGRQTVDQPQPGELGRVKPLRVQRLAIVCFVVTSDH